MSDPGGCEMLEHNAIIAPDLYDERIGVGEIVSHYPFGEFLEMQRHTR